MEEYRQRNVGRVYPMDFDDVYGGPPKTALFFRHQDRSPFPERSLLYSEIFSDVEDFDDDFGLLACPFVQPPPAQKRGRNLPAFRIPCDRRFDALQTGSDFYDEVFGLFEQKSSTFTSELKKWGSKPVSFGGSPLRTSSMADDVVLSAFASKLKPIKVRSPNHTDSCSEQNTDAKWTVASVGSYMEYTDPSTDCHKRGTPCPNQSIQSMKTACDKSNCNPEINSPLSVTATSTVHETDFLELPEKAFGDDEFYCEFAGDGEFAGDFTIEVMPRQVGEDSNVVCAIADAIAWAKEKYGTGDSENLAWVH